MQKEEWISEIRLSSLLQTFSEVKTHSGFCNAYSPLVFISGNFVYLARFMPYKFPIEPPGIVIHKNYVLNFWELFSITMDDLMLYFTFQLMNFKSFINDKILLFTSEWSTIFTLKLFDMSLDCTKAF